MAHKKAGGTAKNLRDSQPKYLGVKAQDGQTVATGDIIVRQRGTRYLPGTNVGLGKDHTLFSLSEGKVKFREARKVKFDGSKHTKKVVDVL